MHDQQNDNAGDEFSNDLLIGAGAIAEWLYGDAKFRRRVHHLASTSRNLKTFKIGCKLHALKSDLRASFKDQSDQRDTKS